MKKSNNFLYKNSIKLEILIFRFKYLKLYLCDLTHTNMKYRLMQMLLLVFVIFSCKNLPENYVSSSTSISADSFFHNATETLVSAHRGGSGIENYPENALETIQFLYDRGIRVFEIDVIQSSDKKIMLLHDNHLERTTSGQGSLKGKTSEDLRALNLVDDFGNETNYKMPYLEEVLEWAKNKNAYFMLDFKDSAKYEDVIELVRKTDMEDHVVLIGYSVAQSKKQHRLAPEMMLSVSARNKKELDWILDAGIPTEKMIAFTGTKLSNQELYDTLNELNIPVILGTLGNLDQRAAARNENLYQKWSELGIQIIATDRALDAYEALK